MKRASSLNFLNKSNEETAQVCIDGCTSILSEAKVLLGLHNYDFCHNCAALSPPLVSIHNLVIVEVKKQNIVQLLVCRVICEAIWQNNVFIYLYICF